MPSGLRILIVEDNLDLRLDLGEVFHLEGYEVSTATDGRDALAVLAKQPVEIVVSDYEMPFMNGISLLQVLRGQEATAKIPFILISGGTPPVIENDPDYHFLKKPVAIETLISIVEKIFAHQQDNNQPAAD